MGHVFVIESNDAEVRYCQLKVRRSNLYRMVASQSGCRDRFPSRKIHSQVLTNHLVGSWTLPFSGRNNRVRRVIPENQPSGVDARDLFFSVVCDEVIKESAPPPEGPPGWVGVYCYLYGSSALIQS